MKMMLRIRKKYVSIFAAALAAIFLCACQSTSAGAPGTGAAGTGAAAPAGNSGAEKKITVAAAIFPEYDWAREILAGEPGRVDLKLIVRNGADLHSYQPSAKDIMDISSCDVLIYTGGESSRWVDDLLRSDVNPDMKVVNLLEALGDAAKEEEIVEGMQEESGEAGQENGDHEDTGGPEYDEHVWLSVKNAKILCGAIKDALKTAEPECADLFEENCRAYTAKMDELDARYEEAVRSGHMDTLLFGDRFPFRYLTEDYGINYYAAFSGCSAETEASFETVAFLAGKMDELGLQHVMTIEGSDGRIADTIIKNTKEKNQTILTLNSLQSVTEEEMEGGLSWLSVMEENLDVLREALE